MKTTSPRPLAISHFMRPGELAAHLKIGLSTLWAWCKREDFPKPLHAGPRVTLFDVHAVESYLRRGV